MCIMGEEMVMNIDDKYYVKELMHKRIMQRGTLAAVFRV